MKTDHFWSPGSYLNKLDRGPPGENYKPNIKILGHYGFRQEIFFSCFSLNRPMYHI